MKFKPKKVFEQCLFLFFILIIVIIIFFILLQPSFFSCCPSFAAAILKLLCRQLPRLTDFISLIRDWPYQVSAWRDMVWLGHIWIDLIKNLRFYQRFETKQKLLKFQLRKFLRIILRYNSKDIFEVYLQVQTKANFWIIFWCLNFRKYLMFTP